MGAPSRAEREHDLTTDRRSFIEVGDGRLFCVDRGRGRPVVLVHGWGSDHTSWAAVSARLESTYRVVAVDLRGHGRSTTGAAAYPFARLAQDLYALLRHLGLEETPILVGHSMGGMVVQQLAADHPETDWPIVILDADLNPPGLWRALMTATAHLGARWMRWMARLLGERLSLRPYPEVLARVAYSRRWRRAHRDHLQLEATRFLGHNTSRGLGWSFLAYATRPDLTRALGGVSRALLVRGAQDRIMSQRGMEALARAIPGAKLVVLEDAGHMTIAEAPGAVADLVDAFARAT